MKFLTPTVGPLLGLYFSFEYALKTSAEPIDTCVCRKPIANSQDRLLITLNQCEALQLAGSAHVLFPSDEAYHKRTSSYWSVSAQLRPNCMVQPLSTEEVSETVKILLTDVACGREHFAIRSGGHTTWAGSNNIDDGVTIDLGLMNGTTLDVKTNIASIQPGSCWNQVYATLDPKGYTVAGGRAGSVGVAGFLTGGGNSFYTAQQGFACDNVKSFEVVLASGLVVTYQPLATLLMSI